MKTPPRGNPFDFCDDVSGGEMEGYCALLAEERRDAERKRTLGTLSQSWSAEQRATLDRLRDATEKLDPGKRYDNPGSRAFGRCRARHTVPTCQ